MDPRLVGLARRNWQAVAALLVLLVFGVVHTAGFQPLLGRYRADLRRAAELGMPLDAGEALPPPPSPRTTSLLAGNALNAAVAEDQGTSGALTAGLLDELTRLAVKCGLEVVATEQGLVTQLPTSTQVRARLKLRGRLAGFVDLLGEFAGSKAIIAVESFELRAGEGGRQDIEIRVSQLVLKRAGGPR